MKIVLTPPHRQVTACEYKTARQRLGTQAEVAARLGVARSTVAHREGGGMPSTTEAALAILALPKKSKRAKRPNMGITGLKHG